MKLTSIVFHDKPAKVQRLLDRIATRHNIHVGPVAASMPQHGHNPIQQALDQLYK